MPHFGLVSGSINAHLDALEERVSRWSDWLREQMRAGVDEVNLVPAFAEYEATDLQANGATAAEVEDYETADPSYMAVSAATRYWRKYHPA